MINEYVLSKGIRSKLSLDALSQKYDSVKKQDVLKNILNKGLNYSDLPKNIQISYLRDDVLATADIFQKQEKLFKQQYNLSLIPIRDLMCQFCSVLTDIERSGMAIDLQVLEQVDLEYEQEQAQLNSYLNKKVRDLMGDLEVNLSSPEQLSQVIYSCKLVDKNTWKDEMNIGVDARGKSLLRPNIDIKSFRNVLTKCFKRSHKVRAVKCAACDGRGAVSYTHLTLPTIYSV